MADQPSSLEVRRSVLRRLELRRTPHSTSGRSDSHITGCPASVVRRSTFGQCSAGNGRSVWKYGWMPCLDRPIPLASADWLPRAFAASINACFSGVGFDAMTRVYDASTQDVNDARTSLAHIVYRSRVRQDPEHKKAIGRRLAKAREAAELNQTQVGNEFGATKATVSGWERGANYPDLAILSRLVKLYRTTADHILFDAPTFSARTLDLAQRLEALSDPELRRFTFANVESMIVNAEENLARLAAAATPGQSPTPEEQSPATPPSRELYPRP